MCVFFFFELLQNLNILKKAGKAFKENGIFSLKQAWNKGQIHDLGTCDCFLLITWCYGVLRLFISKWLRGKLITALSNFSASGKMEGWATK